MATSAERLCELFAGNRDAFGHYRVQKTDISGKKIGPAKTERGTITNEHWERHLAGTHGLGVIPIGEFYGEPNSCMWGAIDVDDYKIDIPLLAEQLFKMKIPMIACSTKSGGAHIYVFFKKPISAESLQHKLREISAKLGHGGSEIFPKQTEILHEKGDVGNWINMPYFDGDNSTRKAYAPNGQELSVVEFLEVAERSRLDPGEFLQLSTTKNDEFEDGPPCLQILADLKVGTGARNNGLFNFGIYGKKAFPAAWRTKVEEYNKRYIDPPLPDEEVQTAIKQLEKKDYSYQCDQQPICQHCNAPLCKTRKNGIGNKSNFPTITSLSKLDSEPPLWFLDVEGRRIELNTSELQQQEKFQRVCMEQLNTMPPRMKAGDWAQLVNSLMSNLNVIEAPDDSTTAAAFEEELREFLTRTPRDKNPGGLERSAVLIVEVGEEEFLYFRLRDIMTHLRQAGFNDWGRNKVANELRSRGFEHKFFSLRGSGVNTWGCPAVKYEGTFSVRGTQAEGL